MLIELKIPSPGESIAEVEIANWFVENGDTVSKDQEIGEIESEKATLPLIAEDGGKIELLAEVGDTVAVGSVVCKIDTSVKPAKKKTEYKPEASSAAIVEKSKVESKSKSETAIMESSAVKTTPVARKMMEQEGLNVDDIINGLRKITASDVDAVLNKGNVNSFKNKEISREESRTKLSQLRKKISERLVAVKNETAMLTTFNEVDMSTVMNLRKKHQEKFIEKHGIKVGFMSFFAKAATEALKLYPTVNSFLDGDVMVSPEYYDIGIAVTTEKGLMVPVLRNTESMSLAEIEQHILVLAGKARKNRISMDDMSGGTFTITNGGVFGSMLSTPILNPPQSGILGMHNIIERPVAINGKVEIRPMMYLALSYDHRVIDGRDSVGFLKTVKESIEDPPSMLFGSGNAESVLLDL
jgi:2-oxoglutarate dehydrogenase E2 component (dihydrolipoamide succinyltransferase)